MQADAQGAAGPVEGSSEQGAPTAPQKRAETRRARSTHQLGEQQQHQLGTLARWRLKLSGLLPRLPRLTVLGRSTALLAFELALNVLVWTIALALWAPSDERRPVLSLGLIAWTLGLRHGLDMDHIVAIDVSTRNLVALGKRPVTCGLWFSLGHSTIVLAATLAIIASIDAIDKMDQVETIGGWIGTCVSASFLFLLALINSVILWKTLQQRKAMRAAALASTGTEGSDTASQELAASKAQAQASGGGGGGCLARIGRPLFKFIDAPWKLYPIGVLFGLGFDTASEVLLLGVSATAQQTADTMPIGEIVLLPMLFLAGMTMVDSVDSVIVCHAYVIPSDKQAKGGWRGWHFIEHSHPPLSSSSSGLLEDNEGEEDVDAKNKDQDATRPLARIDPAQMNNVTIVLTALSIVLAFFISLVQFMGLAAEKCASCAEAAENDPGLSGQWWRFWLAVGDNSEYVGAAVVGAFVLVFAGWGIGRWLRNKRAKKAQAEDEEDITTAV